MLRGARGAVNDGEGGGVRGALRGKGRAGRGKKLGAALRRPQWRVRGGGVGSARTRGAAEGSRF